MILPMRLAAALVGSCRTDASPTEGFLQVWIGIAVVQVVPIARFLGPRHCSLFAFVSSVTSRTFIDSMSLPMSLALVLVGSCRTEASPTEGFLQVWIGIAVVKVVPIARFLGLFAFVPSVTSRTFMDSMSLPMPLALALVGRCPTEASPTEGFLQVWIGIAVVQVVP